MENCEAITEGKRSSAKLMENGECRSLIRFDKPLTDGGEWRVESEDDR